MKKEKQYPPDILPWALDEEGGFYSLHVAAMTAEGLHSKADIATQLAWRDAEIARLEAKIKRIQETAA